MKRPLFHIALVLVALLYCGECVLPCSSAFADECAQPALAEHGPGHEHQDEHQEGGAADRQSAAGHCDHCSCICHSPIAPTKAADEVPALQSPARLSSMIAALVWAEAPPPDHIPIL